MTSTEDAITVALTAGEPAGIGPDLCVQLAGEDLPARIVVVGDPEVLDSRARMLGVPIALVEYEEDRRPPRSAGLEVLPVPVRSPVVAGRVDPSNAQHVLGTLEAAANGCLQGRFDALVTAPVHKGVINDAGLAFTGHTEYFAELCARHTVVMMLVAPGIRVALVTTHLPLGRVPEAITAARLENVIRVLVTDLVERFALATPRILVCGLNPHAGEGGHLGREEIEIIEPTLSKLRGEGIDLRGPCPADTAFTPDRLAESDVVLAMYHDQGLPVLKHLGFGTAVNVTLGLPIIRTSVDHGTALDLAGSGAAHVGSLRSALDLAAVMARTQRGL